MIVCYDIGQRLRVNEQEHLSFARHGSLAAQLPYMRRDDVSENAKYGAFELRDRIK